MSIVSFILGCNVEPTRDEIIKSLQKHDFSIYSDLPSCDCAELEENQGKLMLNNNPFSGTCFSSYPNIQAKYEEKQLFEGELYGYRMIFSPAGDTLSKNEYKEGKVIRKSVGINETCNCDQLKKVKQLDGSVLTHYYDKPFTGTCQRFFPPPNDDKVYLEARYKNGKLHGTTKIFDKNENLMYEEKYINGEKE